MARKKKNKQLKRQKAKQRRANIARKRKKQVVPSSSFKHRQEALLLDDMMAMFPDLENVSDSEMIMDQFMLSILNSGSLAEEPEFIDLLFSPMESVVTFLKVAEERNIDPEDLDNLPEEEQIEIWLDLTENVTKELLTDEFREDIVHRLEKMQRRLKKSRRQDLIAQIDGLQMVLQNEVEIDGFNDLWPGIGLILAITNRSIAAGFSLTEIQMEGTEELDHLRDELGGTLGHTESPQSHFERVAQSAIAQKAEGLIKRIPGIGKFLDNQIDLIWDEGEEAILNGELHLNIYSEAELEEAEQKMKEILGINENDDPDLSEEKTITDAQGKAIVTSQVAYVEKLFSSETRLDTLRQQIKAHLNSNTFDKKWTAFLFMLDKELSPDEALMYNKALLSKALFAEMRREAPVDEAAESQ